MFRSYRNCFRFSNEFSINLYFCIMYEYIDKDLGKIVVKQDRRKKKVFVIKMTDHFQVTVPSNFPYDKLPEIIVKNKPELLKLKSRKYPIIDEETKIDALTFCVKICRTSLFNDKIKMTLANKQLTIHVPESADIKDDIIQQQIREMIRMGLRKEAKRVLPHKTMFFANKFGLTYNQVKINSSKGRWGSCSSRKIINYSLYLMLLDEKYIDYIVLHELAHTKYMSHNDDFWNLLSKFCGEDARKIRDEMKQDVSKSKIMLFD